MTILSMNRKELEKRIVPGDLWSRVVGDRALSLVGRFACGSTWQLGGFGI